MSAPSQFLDRARQIDADIQALDRRRFIASWNHAPFRVLVQLDAQRNAKVREWSQVWQTKRVSP